MATCKDCSHKEPAPAEIARCTGRTIYCPIHCIYCNPHDPACSYIDRDGPCAADADDDQDA